MNLLSKKISKISLAFFIALLGFALINVILSSNAKAVSAGDWKPGRIIDDAVFFNKDSMSISQIQDFLNSKVPVCDTNNPFKGWIGGVYNSAPYTCLKDYSTGGKSAAQIIWEAGQTHGINPQVLIVMLQKESALVTDTWAAPWQYKSAMGYGCPDTAECDSKYYGFSNQVNNAAWQLKRYTTNPDGYNFKSGVTRNIQWSPNGACGSSAVYLENSATAALYNYTPYQPNQAALNNLYGTGDGCSAYGNRNFWRMFNDWFGGTSGPNYSWSLVSQMVYTDNTKSLGSGLQNLVPGQRVYASITVRNQGNLAWSNSGSNPVRLGTSRNFERSSPFCDNSWLSCSRPAALKEASVAPGATGTFEFWMTVPANAGANYQEYFTPVAEGAQWMPDIGMFYGINVKQPTYTWQLTNQYVYKDSSKTTQVDMGNLKPGDKAYVGFTAKNTGNVTWTNSGNNPVVVGTLNPYQRQSAFSTGSSWTSSTRPAILKEASVAPGETGTFEFWMTANSGGVYNERYGLLMEGVRWFNDTGLSYYANVR